MFKVIFNKLKLILKYINRNNFLKMNLIIKKLKIWYRILNNKNILELIDLSNILQIMIYKIYQIIVY